MLDLASLTNQELDQLARRMGEELMMRREKAQGMRAADAWLTARDPSGRVKRRTPRPQRTSTCVDCGLEFEVALRGRIPKRCPDHTDDRDRRLKREWHERRKAAR